MWIESMNSCELHCITQGLQIDKAGLNTKIQSQMDKTNDFYMKTGMTLASQLASGTSCALFWMKRSWLVSEAKELGQTKNMTCQATQFRNS